MSHAFFMPLVLRTSREAPTVLKPLGSVVKDYLVRSIWEAASNEAESPSLGEVKACEVLLGLAADQGMEWEDIVATGPEGLSELHVHIFDSESGEYSEEFLASVGAASGGGDLLYVEEDLFLNHAWGPQALRTLAQHYSHCSHIVVKLSDNVLAPDNAVAWAEAVVRKARLEAMGFANLPGTPFMFLDLAFVVGELPEALERTYA